MHHVEADFAYREKALQQLYKNAASCIEQILKAIPQKTVAVQPPATYHPSRKVYMFDEPNIRGTVG